LPDRPQPPQKTSPAALPSAAILAKKLEFVPPAKLIDYPDNPVQHSDEEVRQLALTIEKDGWTNPIQIDPAGVIISGHCRKLAALRLGMAEVPCLRFNVSAEVARRLRISDNQLAKMATWDMDALKKEVLRLFPDGEEVDIGRLDGLGFSEIELSHILDGWGADLEFDKKESDTAMPYVKIRCKTDEARVDVEAKVRGLLADHAGVQEIIAG
jgi:hypothetical protein